MKTIRFNILLSVVGISFYLTVLMWLFLGIYFLRDPSYLLANPIPFWSVALLLIVSAGFLILTQTKPLAHVQKILNSGQTPTQEQIDLACKIMARLPKIIFSFIGLAFFVGPALSVVIGGIRGTIPFSIPRIVYSMLFSGGIGLMAGIQSLFLVNLVVQGLRIQLKMYHIPQGEKIGSLRKKQIAVALAIGFFVGGIFIGMSYGYLSNPPSEWRSSFIMDTIFLGSICMLISIGSIVAVATDERRKLIRIGKALQELSSGGISRLEKIEIIGADEIGELTHTLNLFMDKQQSSFDKIRVTAKDVLNTSRTLEHTIVEMNSVTENSLAAVEQVKQQGKLQKQAFSEVERVLESLISIIHKVSANVETQSTFVEQSSSSITEMTANITSVSDTTQKAEVLTVELDSAAHSGASSIEDSLSAIHEIEEAAKEVATIVQTISNISAQTNLLAMNAAIEAAHAGNMGKGFAVVANEVRKLASDTAISAKAISEKINDMAKRVSKGVNASKKAHESFNQVTSGVIETRNLTGTIAQAMAEQKYGADEILGSVTHLVQATSNISISAQEQKTYSEDIQQKMIGLQHAFLEISKAVENQEAHAQLLKQTVENLHVLSEKSKEVSNQLESILQ
jgi:methyl-accepting chemotaxis protein